MDNLAISMSSLCILHCLALPFVLASLPVFVGVLPFGEGFHVWMVVVAVPVSLAAILTGQRTHGRLKPAAIATLGILLLLIGALGSTDQRLETVMTVAGGLVLAVGHILNRRLARQTSVARLA
jgi:drug/metabolite transporter (DMT)-like permease